MRHPTPRMVDLCAPYSMFVRARVPMKCATCFTRPPQSVRSSRQHPPLRLRRRLLALLRQHRAIRRLLRPLCNVRCTFGTRKTCASDVRRPTPTVSMVAIDASARTAPTIIVVSARKKACSTMRIARTKPVMAVNWTCSGKSLAVETRTIGRVIRRQDICSRKAITRFRSISCRTIIRAPWTYFGLWCLKMWTARTRVDDDCRATIPTRAETATWPVIRVQTIFRKLVWLWMYNRAC
mmetsp:Transcript_33084/g.53758  ORF Transcript_33084/g.53758 Transcript_33084/m.53758 type:complete len:237 (+) Transcript_33084:1836-2546(+)